MRQLITGSVYSCREISIINPDTDGDGLSDGDEVNVYGTNPLVRDTDADNLADNDEIILGFDPLNPDTNGNGILDGNEKVQQEIGSNNIADELKVDNDALETARLLDLRAAAGKFFVLVTDATYKIDNRYGIPSMDYEIELLKNSDINGDFYNQLMAIADKIGDEVVDNGVWVYL